MRLNALPIVALALGAAFATAPAMAQYLAPGPHNYNNEAAGYYGYSPGRAPGSTHRPRVLPQRTAPRAPAARAPATGDSAARAKQPMGRP